MFLAICLFGLVVDNTILTLNIHAKHSDIMVYRYNMGYAKNNLCGHTYTKAEQLALKAYSNKCALDNGLVQYIHALGINCSRKSSQSRGAGSKVFGHKKWMKNLEQNQGVHIELLKPTRPPVICH